jgi:hypothetical protein
MRDILKYSHTVVSCTCVVFKFSWVPSTPFQLFYLVLDLSTIPLSYFCQTPHLPSSPSFSKELLISFSTGTLPLNQWKTEVIREVPLDFSVNISICIGFSFLFLWCWGWNSGPCVCKASAIQLNYIFSLGVFLSFFYVFYFLSLTLEIANVHEISMSIHKYDACQSPLYLSHPCSLSLLLTYINLYINIYLVNIY